MGAVIANPSEVDQLSRGIMRLIWLDSRRLAQTLAGYDLTVPRFFTLLAINRQGSACRMGDLAHQMVQASPTLTGIVTRLEADGLVERVMDLTDRRVVRVRATERAKKMLDEILAARHDQVARTLDRALSPDERAGFLHLLDRYLEALAAESR